MEVFEKIEQKLQQFSKKYYTNELIKGALLFTSLGLIYLFITLFIEHFLWLNTSARTLLFWVFITVETLLLIRFILFPIFKLIGLKKGISSEEASKIIGAHFPEVSDKLINILQLKNHSEQSDLLLASISQKSEELQPIPFSKAINFKSNIRYAKYALIPLFIWGLSLLTGINSKLNQSFERVMNPSKAYTPPAPFYFIPTDSDFTVIKGKSITIYFETKGESTPQETKIHFNDQQYYMQNNGNGLFSYTFNDVQNSISFFLKANKVTSKSYSIQLINTPSIQNIALELNYPGYLKKRNEIIKNLGNINVPQGTFITWKIKTSETDSVAFTSNNKRTSFKKDTKNEFSLKRRILNSMNYQLSTSNENLKDYEQLQFSIQVIKDEVPNINVQSNIDSITRGNAQFYGQVSDDHGISKLELVYSKENNNQTTDYQVININKEAIQTFFHEFPNNLKLQEKTNYELYFQVFDNDRVNGAKKAVSQKFYYRQKSAAELKEELLQEQKDHINKLENSLEKQQNSKKDLEKIQLELQNKKNISWSDQKNIKDLIKRQEQYKQMMERQTDKIQENFEEKEENTPTLNDKKENLKKRIEELKKIDKQQKLLDELKELADKLKKEDLIKKTKELAEQNKQKERSLERILEMTKRYYVEQKMNQITEKLNELSKKQEELSKKEDTSEEQKEANKEFDDLKKDIDELEKDNEKLKEPMDIPSMEEMEKQAEQEMKKSLENMEQKKSSQAKKNQKKAAKKMKEMSKSMQNSMQSMSAEMEEENMESLRQVLKNLVTFSFNQEDLMNDFSNTNAAHPNFGTNIKKQYQLKTYFEHIDDSLFALSMRVPSISTKIQEELANAHYNIDESLDNLADNKITIGVSNQQYVMTSANTLADMLSNTLDAMQNPQQGMGQGKGKGGKGDSFSLPDIIQKQNDIMQKMKDGMKQGEDGKPKEGEGKKGQKGQKGQKEGKQGEGQQGENGEQMDGELYKIFKEQSQLRQQLQDAIKNGKDGNGAAKKALQQMEELENKILENGFNQENLKRMQALKYELLKLEKASFEQGKKQERKSNTNLKEFKNTNKKELKFKELFYNQTEILNRQSLPLQQNYKQKVKQYFTTTKKEGTTKN
ncbi:hypothetical protein SAMN04489761_2956 [Tenacibaculum sp. MAR_2009_124]|uniref:DUF4175 family protein n=1 Tax=Tenacibaculum sp. MAR_2009_124 TaxID=1250059 RepID=UPI00089BCA28|nr:DUF4175 family protein [Tenacibaculum sp. MAR_2009_124]SEC42490.1 hypothetical protein SAMN04489761_2956 [Tenacibaculum sp. MAR_2009_124]